MAVILPIKKSQLETLMASIRLNHKTTGKKTITRAVMLELYSTHLFKTKDVSFFENEVLAHISTKLYSKPKWELYSLYRLNQLVVKFCEENKTELISDDISTDEIYNLLVAIVTALKWNNRLTRYKTNTKQMIKKNLMELLSDRDLELLNKLTFDSAFSTLEQFKVLERIPKTNKYKFPHYKTLAKLKVRIYNGLESI